MGARTPPAQIARAAESAVADVLRSLGARVSTAAISGPGRADLHVVTPDGRPLLIEVKAAAVVTPAKARQWASREDADVTLVVVGDLIAQGAKDILRERGFGWLDRRGHLRVTGPGVWLDAQVPAIPRAQAALGGQAPVRGVSGLSTAAAALVWPESSLGVRELAKRVGLSPASVSKARARLRAAGLLSEDGRPAIPELFWATVPLWTVPRVGIARVPRAHEARRLVSVGTRAAVALGAPVVATQDHPVELLAPDEDTYHRLRLLLAGAPADGAPATLGVAPTPLVVDDATASRAAVEGWPAAHPVFVALELAQDPGRGSESLESWLPAGVRRVW